MPWIESTGGLHDKCQKELKFHKFQNRFNSFKFPHDSIICIVSFIYLPKQHGDWRAATPRVNMMKSTITFLWFYFMCYFSCSHVCFQEIPIFFVI
jgi:hypothetical protein